MSELSDLLTALPVPEHPPGFWDELEARLAAVDAATSRDVAIAPLSGDAVPDEHETSRPARRRQARVAVLAAAAAVVALIIGLAITDDDPSPSPVLTDDPPTTSPAPATTSPPPTTAPLATTTPASTTTVPATEDPAVPVIDVGESVERFDVGEPAQEIAAGPDTVWVLPPGDVARTSLIGLDAITGEVLHRITLPDYGHAVSAGGWLWVRAGPAEDGQAGLWRIDPATGAVSRPAPDVESWPVAGTDDALWAENRQFTQGSGRGDDVLVVERRDPDTGALVAGIEIPTQYFDGQDSDVSLAASDNAVWVSTSFGSVVQRIDPATNEIVATIDVGGSGSTPTLVADGDDVWLVSADFVRRIDGETNTVDPRTPESFSAWEQPRGAHVEAVLAGDTLLAIAPGGFYRIDTGTMTLDAVLDLDIDPAYPSSFVTSGNAVWFAFHAGFGQGLPWVGRLPLETIAAGAPEASD